MIRVLVFHVDNSIDEVAVDFVEREIGSARGDRLFLVLRSYGGDPASAVRIMKHLHSRFNKIEAVIPSRAMSAATLMALGCDCIHLNAGSIIGPLDLQIPHPGDRTTISSLDIRDSFFSLAGLVDNIAHERLKTMLQGVQMNKADATKIAYESANNFVKPLLDQIDPFHLQSSLRSAQVGERYALDLLACRMMKGQQQKAAAAAKALAYDYAAHNFAITRKEAKDQLKLDVSNLEALPEWSAIKLCIPDRSITTNDVIYYREIDYVSQQPQSKAQ
jgi:hypothetical protein